MLGHECIKNKNLSGNTKTYYEGKWGGIKDPLSLIYLDYKKVAFLT